MKQLKTSMKSCCFSRCRAGWLAGVVLSILSLVSIAKANLTITETLANFGTFSQLNAAVTGSDGLRANACVPASVANGLMFLQNTYNVPGLMQAGYGTVNQLVTDMGTTAAGTIYPNMVSGTATYVGPAGQNVSPPVTIVGGQVKPTATWGSVNGYNIQNNVAPSALTMYNWLSANYAVEFWINWTGGGAHSLTLYGINIETDANGNLTGNGTMSFIDPFGGAVTAGGNNASAFVVANAPYITAGNGFLFMGYTGGAAGNPADPDNVDGISAAGYIVTDLAEAVPEPSTYLAGALLLLPFGVSTFRVLRKNRTA